MDGPGAFIFPRVRVPRANLARQRNTPKPSRAPKRHHRSHDRDGDGNITRFEFINMLTTMELLKPLPGASRRYLSAEDGQDGDNGEKENIANHAHACRVFEELDTDNSGELSASEFIDAYHRYLKNGGFAMAVADKDHDEALGELDGGGWSRVHITAVKWWPADTPRGCERLEVSYSASLRVAPPALGQLSTFLAGAEEGAIQPSFWVDVEGPQHPPTLSWLRGNGLESATSQPFREEGVWYKGELLHPVWGVTGPDVWAGAAPGKGRGRVSHGGAAAGATSMGVIVPTQWLANVPFREGASRAVGCCKRLGGDRGGGGGRRSLHWMLCGSREGTVFVTPHDAAHNRKDVDPHDQTLASFWSLYVHRYSKGERNVMRDTVKTPAAAQPPEPVVRVDEAGPQKPAPHPAASRFFDPAHHEGANALLEAMVRGGEFHVASKHHLHAQPPFLVRNMVGVFVAGVPGEDASIMFTLRPFAEDGIVTKVLDGYRELLDAKQTASRSEGAQHFLESLKSGMMAAAIADSLAVRYNDLVFRLTEHWAAVLDVCIHEQPSSLHQRHMIKLDELAEKLHSSAEKVVICQRLLSGPNVPCNKPASAHFFEVFLRRAEHMERRAAALKGRVAKLQELYKTRLDEERNWMVTALTLFTAGTWPLSFLTGYFGMNFQNMAELGKFRNKHARANANLTPHTAQTLTNRPRHEPGRRRT